MNKQESITRLREAHAIIDGIPDVQFDLHDFSKNDKKVNPHKCGTIACAGGWLAAHPYFKKFGLFFRRSDRYANKQDHAADSMLYVAVVHPIVQKELEKMKRQSTTPVLTFSTTLIYGVDANSLTNDEMFEVIRDIENEIKTLDKIETKPKALAAKITSLERAVIELVRIVDARPIKGAVIELVRPIKENKNDVN